MPVFINTRPSNRATNLTYALQQNNISVVELPLLQMTALSLSKTDISMLSDLQRGHYDLLVVVSPTAAEIGCHHLQNLFDNCFNPIGASERIQTVAVGQTTANKLAEFGISAIFPKVTSNEGMLSLDCINQLNQHNQVLIWRGQGGRKLLIDELQRREVEVDILELYKRRIPSSATKKFQQWQKHWLQTNSSISTVKDLPPTVLISSGEAFENWRWLITTQQTLSLRDFNYFALGERLSQKLNYLKLPHQLIENLHPNTIISVLSQNGTSP